MEATSNGHVTIDSEKQFDRTLWADLPESLDVTSLGDGLRLLKRDTVELNYEFATEILEMAEFAADRPLDDNHVLKLKNAMSRGTFLSEHVNIVSCNCDGKQYRMNGQHTCWARLEMPAKYRCPINFYRYSAKTDNDMRRLYASIDRNKGRDKQTVVCSYMYGTPEWEGYGQRVLKLLSEGLGLWLWPIRSMRQLRDGDDRAYLLMTEHYKVGKLVAEFIKHCSNDKDRHLLRAATVAGMLETYSKDAADANTFWGSVRDGIGFSEKTDPRLVLRNALTNSAVSVGSAYNNTDKKKVDSEEMYRWCIHCWNVWRKQQPIKVLRINMQKNRPIAQ